MSYSCIISFKQIEPEDIYDFLMNFKKASQEKKESIVRDSAGLSPMFNEFFLLEKPVHLIYKNKTKEYLQLRQKTKDWINNNVFKYPWFYDKQHKLLGFYSIPNELRNLFDGTYHFQNSCDQNYEFEYWNGIKLFEELSNKWKNASNEEIKQAFPERHNGETWEEMMEFHKDEEEEFCYYKKSFAYEDIEETIEKSLYSGNDFFLSLFSNYDNSFLNECIGYILEETNKFILSNSSLEEIRSFLEEAEKENIKSIIPLLKEKISELEKINN